MKNREKIVEGIQIVLYIVFLFLWFISSKEPTMRLISLVVLTCFSLIQFLKILRRKKLFVTRLILLYVLFVFWSLLSVIWAQDKSLAISKLIDIFCNALFLMISYDFFSEAKISKKTFISIFVVVGVAFIMYVFLYYGVSRYFSMLLVGKRVGREIINVNFIGLISTMTIIILLYSVLNNVYKNKLIALLIIPLLIVALGSGSKKALIGLIIGVLLIVILYLKGKMTWKKVATIGFFFVLLVCSIIAIAKLPYFGTVFRRMDAMIMTLDDDSSVEEGSTEARKRFIEAGINTFINYPITGIGINNSAVITRDLVGRDVYLHCNFVELLACVGIVGFMLYYAIYLGIIIETIRFNKKKKEKDYLPIIMAVALLAIEVGCVTYYEIKTSMYFILMITLLYKQNWANKNCLKSYNATIISGNSSKKSDELNKIKERND